jgi:hypothetical protein
VGDYKRSQDEIDRGSAETLATVKRLVETGPVPGPAD